MNTTPTKRFRYGHGGHEITILVTQHENGYFYATVLYFERIDAEVTLSLRHENFMGSSEEDVKAQAEAWIQKHLTSNFTFLDVKE